MRIIWRGIRVFFAYLLILLLLGITGFLSAELYQYAAKYMWGEGQEVLAKENDSMPSDNPEPKVKQETEIPASAKIDAPFVSQYPELPSGCEVTALAMLLQFKGIDVDKMQLYDEVKKDSTPIVWSPDKKTILYWGNPNVGYVGDATGRSKGFAIYHEGLFPLLQHYIPTGIDMTGQDFSDLERQIASGIPVLAWTTVSYKIREEDWVTWDTPIGPIKTTFKEHAVLLVGYDEESVYMNDPRKGNTPVQVDKATFVSTWEKMGKQALSYLP